MVNVDTNHCQLPVVRPDFMASYDHARPSGHGHPACKRNRLANIGIDCRKGPSEQIDLNLLTDRSYRYICETSDDGWLIGGGDDTKLKRPDTAHAEVWRFGPDNKEHGGIPYAKVDAIMRRIAFAPITLKPIRVNFTPANELELLCEYDTGSIIGQIFGLLSDVLACPCGDYGNPFHITMVRGVKFRNGTMKEEYLDKMKKTVCKWNEEFPNGIMFNDGGLDLYMNREEIIFHYAPKLEAGIEAEVEALRALRN